MADERWTLDRIERERPDLAPLAALHGVLADATLRFATEGDGPEPRAAFSGPPALQWLAGRSLVAGANPAVIVDLVGPLTVRLAEELGRTFPETAEAVAELLAALAAPDFDWPRRVSTCFELAESVPHAELFRFVLLRAVAAPAIHLARSFSPPSLDRWSRPACPFCSAPPAAALAGPGSDRRLVCVLCGGRWTMEGLGCHACGEKSGERLRVLANRDAGPASIEACDTCETAIKVFHESYLLPGPPLAMELLTAALDLVAARDEGVRRDPRALAALYPP